MSSSGGSPGSSSEPRVSRRKGNKKVRTGCLTCKVRKLKCDETKPSCLRCTKTGRKCDGYRLVKKSWSPSRVNLPLNLPALPQLETDDERRAFDYYRRHSATLLAGTVAVGFWTDLVPRLCLSEPAVLHSVLALSSLHERATLHNNADKIAHWSFAFREYGKAITAMTNWEKSSSDEPAAIPLLVCLLFVCVEFLADNEAASQLHICQGRKILSGIDNANPTSAAMEMIKRELVPIYTRLSISSFTFGSRPSGIPLHLKLLTAVPAEFLSVSDARCLLYQIMDEGLEFSTRTRMFVYSPEADPREGELLKAQQQHLLSQLARWHSAFIIFGVKQLPLDQPGAAGERNLLLLYFNVSYVWVCTAFLDSETAFDSHTASFGAIISLASSIVSDETQAEQNTNIFSFESEVIGPLYWTATKCRHPLLRREALRLLMSEETKHRQENLWHGYDAAVIAARVIELEEEGRDMGINQDILFSDTYTFQQWLNLTKEGQTACLGYPSPGASYEDILQEAISKFSLPPSESLDMLDTTTYFFGGAAEAAMARSNSLYLTSSNPEAVLAAPLPSQLLADLESPYGLPEDRRIKNTLIGPKEGEGTWLTMLLEPDMTGTSWTSKREFLKLRG